MGTVSAPALLGGLVDLDMLDDQVGGIEALGVGVGLSVLEETEKDLGGLDGPAGLGDTESLACGSQPRAHANIPSTLRITILQCYPKILLFLCFSLSSVDPAYCMRASLLEGGFQGNSPWAVRPVLPA